MARRRFARWTAFGRIRLVFSSGAVLEIRGRVRLELDEAGFAVDYEFDSEEIVLRPVFEKLDAIRWEEIRPAPAIPRGESP